MPQPNIENQFDRKNRLEQNFEHGGAICRVVAYKKLQVLSLSVYVDGITGAIGLTRNDAKELRKLLNKWLATPEEQDGGHNNE